MWSRDTPHAESVRREPNRPTRAVFFRELENNIGGRAGWTTNRRRADALLIKSGPNSSASTSPRQGRPARERQQTDSRALGNFLIRRRVGKSDNDRLGPIADTELPQDRRNV